MHAVGIAFEGAGRWRLRAAARRASNRLATEEVLRFMVGWRLNFWRKRPING